MLFSASAESGAEHLDQGMRRAAALGHHSASRFAFPAPPFPVVAKLADDALHIAAVLDSVEAARGCAATRHT